MSDIDPKKLKVAELREELKARGLDTKGNKPQLVKRLENALASPEDQDEGEEVNDSKLDASDVQDESINEAEADMKESMPSTEDPTPADEDDMAPPIAHIDDDDDNDESNQQAESEEAPAPEEDEPMQEEVEESEQIEAEADSANQEDVEAENTEMQENVETDEPADKDEDSENKEVEENDSDMKEVEKEPDTSTAEEGKGDEDKSTAKANDDKNEEKTAVIDTDMGDDDEFPEEFKVMDSIGDDDANDTENKSDRGRRDDDRRGYKRRHSDRYRHRTRSPEPLPEIEDNSEWVNATHLLLDKYNADLNLRISKDGYIANPITVEGFAFMWAGARSNYGVKSGKVCYEVKVVDELKVDHLPEEEVSRHVVRVGFSLDSCSTQLGEEPFSYGYGGTGKSSVGCTFTDFGQTFGKLDVIGAYLDYEEENVTISYTKNGEDLGTCFTVETSTLEGKALFPHILLKNCEVEMNFGQKDEPFYATKEGYTFINDIPESERVRGSLPPEKKEDCEMIMMCGLPGAGKTYWATKESGRQPEKKYNILGTNHIIDKMKVMGLPRKNNYAGRWDVLIDKSTKCLNRLFEIAAKKKRNYILDQTNVYPSAQRRKMRPFEGFQRKAVVLVPNEEEFKKRCAQREKEEGKEVPDSAVLEMKANYALPVEGTLFDKVEYVELDQEEAGKIVEAYNKEGKAAMPPVEKRFRSDRRGNDRYGSRHGGGGNYRDRYNKSGGGNYRDNRYGGYNRDRSGGYDRRDNRYNRNDRRGGSSKYMGYSDRDRQRASNYDRRDRDNRSGGNSYGNWNSGRGGSWNNHGNQGSWGNQQGSWGGNQGSYNKNQGSGWSSSSYGNQQGQGWSSGGGSYGNWGGYSQGGSYNQGYSGGR